MQDGSGLLIGAIGVSGPANRFKPRQVKIIAAQVLEAATDVARTLGFVRREPVMEHDVVSRKNAGLRGGSQ